MTTSYPATIDNFINPAVTDSLGSTLVPHANQHDNVNDSVKAIEVELGTLPKGTYTDVKTRLAEVFHRGVALATSSATSVGLIIKGSVSQTANLQEWRDSTGGLLGSMGSGGYLSLGGLQDFTMTGAYLVPSPADALFIFTRASTNVGLKVRASASQSADLQQWTDSTGAVLASVGANGIIATGGIAGAPTIASAATIAPVKQISFVSGVTSIATITPPAPISTIGGSITIIPTGLFSTTTAGNIALATTAIVNRALVLTYDPITSKWYPNY